MISTDLHQTHFVGPPRTANPKHCPPFLPIVKLKGATDTTTLWDLLNSYMKHTKISISNINYLTYLSVSYHLETFITKITYSKSAVSYFYFSIPDIHGLKFEDNQDIDELLNFIRGDKKEEEKKKKKNKRKFKKENMKVKVNEDLCSVEIEPPSLNIEKYSCSSQ